MTQPLYARRSKTVSQIPNFWALVLEQAPPDIDQYIQPSDSSLLLNHLTSFSVSHFEIGHPNGDPRSVSVRFEFGPNEYFDDAVLEKKFWHRRAKDGWTGLVSEPVAIQWKKDRDLTGGLLDMVVAAWRVDQANGKSKSAAPGLTPEQKALKKKIDNTGMGGLSFFAWFGFIGRKISAEESAEATAVEREKRKARRASRTTSPPESDDGEEAEDDEDEIGMSLEIFPDGDDLAIAFTEDLWPGAIKYFSEYRAIIVKVSSSSKFSLTNLPAQAQEQDALSDADFESDDEDLNEPADNSEDESGDEPPAKKQRSA